MRFWEREIYCVLKTRIEMLRVQKSLRSTCVHIKREFLGEIVNNLILQNMFNLMKARSFRWEGGQIQRLLEV